MALLSRVAERLWWLGRDLERAESVARLLNVTYHGRFDPGQAELLGASNTWEAMLATLGQLDGFRALDRPFSDAAAVAFLALDTENPSSVRSSLRQARENARSVRDYLSSETWEAVNRAYREIADVPTDRVTRDGLHDFCDTVLRSVNAVRGTIDSTCVHDEGWWWLIAGTTLERCDMSTRIVDAKYHLLLGEHGEVGGPEDRFQWAALLRSVSGWEAFRRLYPEGITPRAVTHFLLLDPAFPRSLRAAVESLATALDRATAGADPALRNPPMRAVTQLQNRLRFESAESLIAGGLHESLDGIQLDLSEVNQRVGEAFFGWVLNGA